MALKSRRNTLFQKQKGLCHWCGKKCLSPGIKGTFSDTFTIDHVVPRGRGGEEKSSNRVGACRECNLRRNEIEQKLVAVQRFFEFFKKQPLNLFPTDGFPIEIENT